MSIKIKNIKDHEFVGQVINSDDPLRMFRCKIKVSGLLDGIDDEMLPWIFPANTNVFGESGYGNGNYPKEGSWVKVRFPHNDIYSGEYLGLPNPDPGMQEFFKTEEYKNSKVFVFDIEEKLQVLYTQSQGFLILVENGYVNVTKDKVIINAPNIELGEGAVESIIKGDSFNAIWKTHTHVGNLGAPTGPPLQPIDSTLSKQNTTL